MQVEYETIMTRIPQRGGARQKRLSGLCSAEYGVGYHIHLLL